MFGKNILFLGVIVSIVYLYISTSNHKLSRHDKNGFEKNIPTLETVSKQNKVINDTGERLSIPAFGFISTLENKQIAAVMSDEEENGKLAKYISNMCKKNECEKDIDYNSDTKSAIWQKEVIDIIKLLVDSDTVNGSVFIDGNLLRISGVINNQKTKKSLNNILEDIKNIKLNIENKTTFKQDIKVAKIDSVKKVENNMSKQSVIIKKITPKPIKQNSMLDADARVRAILEEFKKNK